MRLITKTLNEFLEELHNCVYNHYLIESNTSKRWLKYTFENWKQFLSWIKEKITWGRFTHNSMEKRLFHISIYVLQLKPHSRLCVTLNIFILLKDQLKLITAKTKYSVSVWKCAEGNREISNNYLCRGSWNWNWQLWKTSEPRISWDPEWGEKLSSYPWQALPRGHAMAKKGQGCGREIWFLLTLKENSTVFLQVLRTEKAFKASTKAINTLLKSWLSIKGFTSNYEQWNINSPQRIYWLFWKTTANLAADCLQSKNQAPWKVTRNMECAAEGWGLASTAWTTRAFRISHSSVIRIQMSHRTRKMTAPVRECLLKSVNIVLVWWWLFF